MANKPGGKPRRITKLVVEEVSLVDKAANGEEFLLYKRDIAADGNERETFEAQAAVITPASVPELAKFIPSQGDSSRSESLPYDAGAVLRTLGAIGVRGEKA